MVPGVMDFIQRCDGDEDELLCMKGGGSRYPSVMQTVESPHALYHTGR